VESTWSCDDYLLVPDDSGPDPLGVYEDMESCPSYSLVSCKGDDPNQRTRMYFDSSGYLAWADTYWPSDADRCPGVLLWGDAVC
jgi:hypothetical protein